MPREARFGRRGGVPVEEEMYGRERRETWHGEAGAGAGTEGEAAKGRENGNSTDQHASFCLWRVQFTPVSRRWHLPRSWSSEVVLLSVYS